ncbi:hypothetical protein ABXV22_07080 [Vibrio rotiferianus]|uniref:hypothetical protein n=1 Tax=Vibrio rotiferianus TaxID=190895 RepID=UPI00339A8292
MKAILASIKDTIDNYNFKDIMESDVKYIWLRHLDRHLMHYSLNDEEEHSLIIMKNVAHKILDEKIDLQEIYPDEADLWQDDINCCIDIISVIGCKLANLEMTRELGLS